MKKKVTINYQIFIDEIPSKVADLLSKHRFGSIQAKQFKDPQEGMTPPEFLSLLMEEKRRIQDDLKTFSDYIALLASYLEIKGREALIELQEDMKLNKSETSEGEEIERQYNEIVNPDKVNEMMLSEIERLNLPEDQKQMYLDNLKKWNQNNGYHFDFKDVKPEPQDIFLDNKTKTDD